MMGSNLSTDVRVLELIGWDLDENEDRPEHARQTSRIDSAQAIVASRPCFKTTSPLVHEIPTLLATLLEAQILRDDLHREMEGLEWSAGLVDLRHLLAFQRRLIFDPEYPPPATPASCSWPDLTELAFGPPLSTSAVTTLTSTPGELVLQSPNPNMRLRQATTTASMPFELHGGSPFFEVAEYQGRWFLRDGYHRAAHLLRGGIVHVPAVIIRASSLLELGAIGPWFFQEQVLFSAHPPYVSDFLLEPLTQQYTRPRTLKTLRVTIEESFGPAPSHPLTGEQR